MDRSPPNPTPERTRLQQQQVVYETACALAQSTSLIDAAPRMLRAICQTLDWEYGALWDMDRAASRLRSVATWHSPSLEAELASLAVKLNEVRWSFLSS